MRTAKKKQSVKGPGLEQFVDNGMILFTVGRIHYTRSGVPCTIRRDDTYATPTEGEIECVRRYAATLRDKVRYLLRWAKKADSLLAYIKAEEAKEKHG